MFYPDMEVVHSLKMPSARFFSSSITYTCLNGQNDLLFSKTRMLVEQTETLAQRTCDTRKSLAITCINHQLNVYGLLEQWYIDTQLIKFIGVYT